MRGAEHGGLQALPRAAGVGAAVWLPLRALRPRLGLSLPGGARLGRGLGGVQLAPGSHHHWLHLHPGNWFSRSQEVQF